MQTSLRERLLPPKIVALPNGKTVKKQRSIVPFIALLVLIAIYYSVQLTGFEMGTLLTRGNQFFVILGRMVPPNEKFFSSVIGPLLDTIKMSVLGTVLGAFLAIPVAMLASINLTHNKVLSGVIKFILSMIRTMPALVTALILTYVFGLGTFAGTLALALFTFSFVGKQLYETIETVDMLPYEAMEAAGANKLRSFVAAIQPQVLPTYLSTSLYTFEGNVRHAAILGYVGAGGIGIILNENLSWREYQNVGTILLCLFITVAIIEFTSGYLRKKLS